MNYVIPKFDHTEIQSFFTYWSDKYSERPMEEFSYSPIIEKDKFSKADLNLLFKWFNQDQFCQLKGKAFERKVVAKIETINALKSSFDQKVFDKHFARLNPEWKLFLLHCISPSDFPILNEHIFKAFHFIKGGKDSSFSEEKMEIFYFERFVPYFQKLDLGENFFQEFNKALWTFGEYLEKNEGFKDIKIHLMDAA